MKDFFISYNKADRTWAEWIAWQLEEAGYTTVIQAWDFRPGSNFVLDMQKATAEAERTIAVLSPNYFTALYTQPEWAAAFAQDPTGEKGTLLPVRVRECDLKGMLSAIVYIDLVGLDEEPSKKNLLDGLHRERAKPTVVPDFPGAVQHTVTKPARFPGQLPPIWNVPHNRNPNFTGRDSILTDLRRALTLGQPIQSIHGLGGVGKTQIVIEYVYRHATEYDVVWWVRAEEAATLVADYAGLAQELDLPQKDAKEQAVIVRAVRTWLGQNGGWLLIFDNSRDPKEIRDYLPQGGTGHGLVTSRNPNWKGVTSSLLMGVFERTESLNFLLKRTGHTDEVAAHKLSEALGDLPLALAQAGAYIEETGGPLTDYLELFKSRRNELWSVENSVLDYPDTVATTWSLSIEQVDKESMTGVDLLNLLAYLGPDDIPRTLLTEGKEHFPKPLSETLTDTLAMNRAISALRRYSLIEVAGDTLSVHRLVQTVVRDRLEDGARRTWAGTAVKLVNNAFPFESDDVRTWPECERLLPHALAVTGYAEGLEVASEDTGRLLNQLGVYLLGRAQFSEAEKLLRWALAIHEKVLGQENPKTAQSLNNLAAIYYAQARYTEAEPLYKLALTIWEKAHGPNHPDVASSLNNFAGLYSKQGKYTEAEPLYKRALTIFEEVFGPNHPSVAQSLNNLAELYSKQGKYTEAEPLYKRALTIFEEVFGPNHPSVAQSLNNLAVLYCSDNKHADAEPLLKQALALRERGFGSDHPYVAIVLENMAVLYEKTGKKGKARRLRERAKRIRSRNQ